MRTHSRSMSDDQRNIHDLFAEVRRHPDFLGGTIFVHADIPEGQRLPSDWREEWLSDSLAERGGQLLEQFTEEEEVATRVKP